MTITHQRLKKQRSRRSIAILEAREKPCGKSGQGSGCRHNTRTGFSVPHSVVTGEISHFYQEALMYNEILFPDFRERDSFLFFGSIMKGFVAP
jgi:hypothetical protein